MMMVMIRPHHIPMVGLFTVKLWRLLWQRRKGDYFHFRSSDATVSSSSGPAPALSPAHFPVVGLNLVSTLPSIEYPLAALASVHRRVCESACCVGSKATWVRVGREWCLDNTNIISHRLNGPAGVSPFRRLVHRNCVVGSIIPKLYSVKWKGGGW